ncbi:hypothetical protein V7S43_010779 [Phytophthora oleae]|uniref:Uncharacterized protein n=1 Tax=Phytophthora oleae TaxID=2107226 RepID=A0ABD3FHI5_9STRA
MTTETPTIKSLPPLRVLSLRSVLPNYRAQGELWEKLFAFAKTHDVSAAGPTPTRKTVDRATWRWKCVSP